MQRTIRFSFSTLLCLSLLLVSGCGGGDSDTTLPKTEPSGRSNQDPSTLVGRWIPATVGSVRDGFPDDLELLKDGTGTADGGVPTTWKTEKNRIVFQSRYGEFSYDYKISGSALTLTDSSQSVSYKKIEIAPELPAGCQAEAEGYIAKHGKNALLEFMSDEWSRNLDAAEGGLLLKYIKYFVSKGSDVNAKKGIALYHAAYCGSPDAVKYLLPKTDVNVKLDELDGVRLLDAVLHRAVHSNRANFEVIRFLVEKGADVNVGWDGSTLLDGAKERGNPQIIMLLESKGAKSGK